MKKSFLLAVIFSCVLNTYAYDFKVANEDGCEIAYNINSDGTTVSVTYTDAAATKRHLSNYADFLCDTMRIPESITYEGKQYTVTGLDSMCFRYINQNIHVLELPATIDSIVFYEEVGIDHYADVSAFYGNSFRSIIMAENNPKYTTEAGILYTKDKSVLLAYPAGNLRDSVYIKEGVVMLGHGALVWARNIRYLAFFKTGDHKAVEFAYTCGGVYYQNGDFGFFERFVGFFYAQIAEFALVVKPGCVDYKYRTDRQKLHRFFDRVGGCSFYVADDRK